MINGVVNKFESQMISINLLLLPLSYDGTSGNVFNLKWFANWCLTYTFQMWIW